MTTATATIARPAIRTPLYDDVMVAADRVHPTSAADRRLVRFTMEHAGLPQLLADLEDKAASAGRYKADRDHYANVLATVSALVDEAIVEPASHSELVFAQQLRKVLDQNGIA
ncbi:hypothetical protein SEA_IAMGROOT_64 [Microbacterium phage IAmGroot]|uniref:Uncharacterized protein n=1 Tax=Microbacterium phage IAmGroot TaxID=2588486 RepID=A0A4Y6E741_9CAUD|nr:hypothetical protein SEA_IAMGROOT_64 [Microbacterium phage IAmGroot]